MADEDRTQATVALALLGGLLMLVGFLVFGVIAVAAVAVVMVMWAGFALGPSKSPATLLAAVIIGAAGFGVLKLGDVVLGEGGTTADRGAVEEARSDTEEAEREADAAATRDERTQRDAAGARGKLRTTERRLRSVRRERDRLRSALRRAQRRR